MSKRSKEEIMTIDGAKRFDFAKVLSAYQRLIEGFAAAFGTAAVVLPGSSASRRWPWSSEGVRRAMEFWMQARAVADTSDDRVCHPAGPVTAHAYLLGNAGLAADMKYHVAGPIHGARPGELASLANEPVVRVYGRDLSSEHGSDLIYAMPTAEELSRVERIVYDAERSLELEFALSAPIKQPTTGTEERYGVITFPHRVYGNGLGRIRVSMRAIIAGSPKHTLN